MADYSLKMHYLVAMPQLRGSYFERAVILLLEHDHNGAMGIVLNKPATIDKTELFKQLKLKLPSEPDIDIILGGPVATDRGLVLHNGSKNCWQQSLVLSDKLQLTTSADVLEAISNNTGPAKALFALGYSGWDAGQLEQELIENSWLTLPADDSTLFKTDADKLLDDITLAAGIHYDQLVSDAGHA